jgi:hypothetical protein
MNCGTGLHLKEQEMQTNVIQIIVAGLLATLAMDLASHALTLARVYAGPVNTTVIGRWFGHLVSGTFTHPNINQAQPLKNEGSLGFLAHYGIGIVIAFIYVGFLQQLSLSNSLVVALGFGFLTSAFPWLWLFPSWGFGVMGLKGHGLLLSSFCNHLIFGVGLYMALGGNDWVGWATR